MFKTMAVLTAIGLGLMAASYPQSSYADGFTGTELLSWSAANQAHYLQVSLGMVGVVAAQIDQRQAECIDTWYLADTAKRHREILQTVKQYPDYHPQGVILALVQKICGKIGS